ncbi:hypothetical protein IAT38_007731 [Cryptococcus sp. DSM 104549]
MPKSFHLVSPANPALPLLHSPSLTFLTFLVTGTHVLLSPYTKVEESFTLHAVHDVLAYGFGPQNLKLWDHVTFPGAVPRSFLPPILLGLLSYPLSTAGVALGVVTSKLDVQLVVRLTLASVFSLSFNHLGRTLGRKYGPSAWAWYAILGLGSFHIPYYAGRTLPNFMALPGVLYSISLILGASGGAPAARREKKQSLRKAIVLLTALAAVVRLELALFVLPVALSLVLCGQATVGEVFGWGVLGGFGSLAISSPIDYFLWTPSLSHPFFPFTSHLQLLWPELSSAYYNAVEGHASEWGIMPFHYYFTNSLPKLLTGSSALLAVAIGGFTLRAAGLEAQIPLLRCWGHSAGARGVNDVLKLFGLGVIILLGGMSALGHKEWRFILPAIPIFQILSALSASSLWNAPASRPWLRAVARLAVLGTVALNLAATAGMTFLSIGNYPGGEVWKVLEGIPGLKEGGVVYFPSYPLQTGASLFTFVHQEVESGKHLGPFAPFPAQREPVWVYSKSEDEVMSSALGVWDSGVNYVVTGDWEAFLDDGGYRWEVVGEVEGLDGVGRGGKYGVQVNWARKLAILERRDGIA